MKDNKFLKPINLYIIIGIILFLMFIIMNRLTNGFYFGEIFYKLESDAEYDFFVFLNNSSIQREAFWSGPNPPLTRIIFRFIFKSLPIEIQDIYPDVQMRPDLTNDIRLNAFSVVCMWIVFAVSIVFLAIFSYENIEGNKIKKYAFVFLTVVSTGVVFAIERGNIVIVAMVCTMFFCFSYDREDRISRELGYILLAVAIAMKIYPVLFCLLLVKKKEYFNVLKIFCYVCLLVFLPLLIAGGIDAVLGYANAIFGQSSSGSNLRAGYLNGLSVFYTISRVFGFDDFFATYVRYFRIFNYIFSLIVSVLSVWVIEKKWLKITGVIIAMYMLPGITHTYMLTFMIIPIICFLNEENELTIRNGVALVSYIALSTLIPISNSEITQRLKDEYIENVANRLSGIMLVHEMAECVLLVLVVVEIIKCISMKIKKRG